MTNLAEATIGCDPEIFVAREGKYFSAHTLIPGTKQEPYPVNDGSVQVDGTALEIGITPSRNSTEFVNCINSVTSQLRSMLPADVELKYTPTAHFDADYFKTLPKKAVELGCEPDYNAWTMSMNPRPGGKLPMRTASGHLHVGWTTDEDEFGVLHYEKCGEVVRELDYYLGIMSLDWDTDGERRGMYGQAGAFRPKSYGVEYRVLSNAWLQSDELKVKVFDLLKLALSNIDKGISLVDEFGDTAIDIVNNSNSNWRQEFPELCERFKEIGVC